MARRVLQIGALAGAVAAGAVTYLWATPTSFPAIDGYREIWPWAVAIGLGTLIAFGVLGVIGSWAISQIKHARTSDLVAAGFGLMAGGIIAAILTIPLSQVTFQRLNQWLPLLALVVFGYLGVAVSVLKRDEIQRYFVNFRRRDRDADHEEGEGEDRTSNRRRGRNAQSEKNAAQVLLDTSAIIDGRIADISQTGFIMGTIVVPRFVLEELQRIADSADTLRRNRGRRGLDILNRLQKETNIPVEITDADFDNIHEVDAKLVKLAKQIHAPIITNDFNLNKVAELQGVKVLNINELANAVKPALLPGEDMDVKIIQEGKELGQGVGYLDDGTMIVVEGGKTFMNNEVEVTVTRVLQTAAGRMIFAHPKAATGANAAIRRSS